MLDVLSRQELIVKRHFQLVVIKPNERTRIQFLKVEATALLEEPVLPLVDELLGHARTQFVCIPGFFLEQLLEMRSACSRTNPAYSGIPMRRAAELLRASHGVQDTALDIAATAPLPHALLLAHQYWTTFCVGSSSRSLQAAYIHQC